MTDITLRTDVTAEVVQAWGEDKTIAQAARVSTLGLDNDREKFVGLVRALWRDGHHSPFMHVGMTIAIECPLFIRSQIVTHTSLARSEFSMRYSEARPEFWAPATDRPLVQVGKALDYRREMGTDEQGEAAQATLEWVAEETWDSYEFLVEKGVAKEVARAVLPQSTYTTLWMTGNLRSWLHFLDRRLEPHAQWEVQDVATQIGTQLAARFPVTYEAYANERTRREQMERLWEAHEQGRVSRKAKTVKLTVIDGGKADD